MLTLKQEKILNIIKEYISINGISPSIRELCKISGLSSTSSVHGHLKKLSEKGYISYLSDKKRSIKLNEVSSYVNIPVIGVISAGTPILASENIETYIPVKHDLTKGRKIFALRVKGDSMINAGIYDKDVVIIVQQSSVENGEIAAILVDDSATVKRFYRDGKGYRLQPENDNYEPIYCNEVTILGKVIGLYREF